jgi:SRSO17 transposase
VPVPGARRLFLPEAWAGDPERLERAGVPGAGPGRSACPARSKPEIASAEPDRLRAAGVRSGIVPADAGYGVGASFRRALSARDLPRAGGIPRLRKLFPAEVGMVPPAPRRRRSSQPPVPATEALAAATLLDGERWRTLTWRRGTKGPLKAAFAARRVRAADGPAVRLHGRNNQHMPGEEVWLVGERRSSGERKYYLSNLPADTPPKRLASAIKARWVCGQAHHQQLEEELGLDHFEGRSWTGLHRHALMTLIAFAFLQHRRLAAAGRGKKKRPAASAEPADDPGRPHPVQAAGAPAASHMLPLPATHHPSLPRT